MTSIIRGFIVFAIMMVLGFGLFTIKTFDAKLQPRDEEMIMKVQSGARYELIRFIDDNGCVWEVDTLTWD